ncbi:MAG: PQQ-binding-like beta-propeller repeat protein [Candidatus Binataceae bacterium]
MFRHDLRHTGLSTVDTSSNPGDLKWIFGTADQLDPSPAIGVYSSPAIGADGTIFVGTENDSLYALTDNGASATEKWAFPTGSSVLSSPAIGPDGTIYFGSGDDNLYAVGISSPPVPARLKISTKSLNFGTVKAGRTKGPQYVIVRNPEGGKKKPGLTVLMQGERLNSAFIPFGVTNGCGAPLPAGARCEIGVTFAPNGRGSAKGTLMIFDNAELEPQSVELKGHGG